MLESAKFYLNKKAKSLDLDRAEALARIQSILDERYPAKARAKSLNDGVLKIYTLSAAVASELRLNQANLIQQFTNTTTRPIQRLHIQITQID